MTTQQKQAVELYKKTLNKNSKFYNEDLQHFIINIKAASKIQLNQSVNNMSYMASKKSDIDFDIETRKLDRAGMFNVANMKVINALD